MAKPNSGAIHIYLADMDLGTQTRSFQIVREVEALDKTCLSESGETFLSGIRKDGFVWDGLFDNVTGIADNTQISNLSQAAGDPTGTYVGSGTALPLSIHFGTAGSLAHCGLVFLTSVQPSSKIGELVKMGAKFAVPTGSWETGTAICQTFVFNATSTACPAIDGGAASTNGGAFYLHQIGHIGGGAARLFFEDATTATGVYSLITDFGTGGTILMTAPRHGQVIENTGTIRRFVRIRYDDTANSATLSASLVRR